MRVHVPFLDNQVVAACMSVPVADRTTAAHAKPLLAAALDGLVPARLLGRPTKGDVTGAPGFRDHFHRVIAWATVEQIPGAWAGQAAPGAILVTPINLTGLPKTHAVVRARYDATIPGFAGEKLIPGGFVEAHDRVIDQWLVPPLGVDVLTRDDDDKPWWLSAHWLRTRSGCEPEAASKRDETYSTS